MSSVFLCCLFIHKIMTNFFRWCIVAGALFCWYIIFISTLEPLERGIVGLFLLPIACWHFFTLKEIHYEVIRQKGGNELVFWVITAVICFLLSGLIAADPGIGLFCAAGIPYICGKVFTARAKTVNRIGGGAIEPKKLVHQKYCPEITTDTATFELGGVKIPLSELLTHMYIQGRTGTGKSVTMKFIMQEIFPLITPGSGKGVLLENIKRDKGSLLEGFRQAGLISCPIHYLNCFDARCSAPDWAAMIQTEEDMNALVSMLVPQKEGGGQGDKFWRDIVNAALSLVVHYFILFEVEWDLHDLMLAVFNPPLLKNMSKAHPALQMYQWVFGSDETLLNIMSSLVADMKNWRVIAKMWRRAKNKVNIDQWCEEGGSILVLGYDAKFDETLGKAMKLILDRVSQNLENSPDLKPEPYPRIFIFLDELPRLGKISRLESLAAVARSKGVCLIYAAQEITQVQSVYGREDASTITGQCAIKVLLKVANVESARWNSDQVGEQEQLVISGNYSSTRTPGRLFASHTSGQSESLRRVATVMPSEFQALPNLKYDGVMRGLYLTTNGNYWHDYTLDQIRGKLIPNADSDYDFHPIPKSERQLIKDWFEEADLERLQIAALFPDEQKAWLEGSEKQGSLPGNSSERAFTPQEWSDIEEIDLEEIDAD